MGSVPDAAALVAAVTELHQLVSAVFGDNQPPDDPAAWSRLAGQSQQIHTRARWCRDATVAIARRAGVPWADIVDSTGVADSTLLSRHQRFLAAEGGAA